MNGENSNRLAVSFVRFILAVSLAFSPFLLSCYARAEENGGKEVDKKSAVHQDKVEAVEARKTALESEIGSLNKVKTCTGDGECEVLEMGFRLCGGPSSYLIVSVSNPQIAKLKAKLTELIAVEKELNQVNPANDCTAAPKAPDAACVKQVCQSGESKEPTAKDPK